MVKRKRIKFENDDKDDKNINKQKKRKITQIKQNKNEEKIFLKNNSNQGLSQDSNNNKMTDNILHNVIQKNQPKNNDNCNVISLFQSQRIHHDIIQVLSEYLQEKDLYNLSQSDLYLFNTITTSESIFKCILRRECNYSQPTCITQKRICKKDLICNVNDPTLIYNKWKRIIGSSTNHQLIKELQDKTFQHYILYKQIWQKLFGNTMTFTAIYRILSFKYWSGQKLISLFDDTKHYLTTRSLNKIEKHLFNPVILKRINNTVKVCLAKDEYSFELKPVINFKQFQAVFNCMYYFEEWFKLINWDHFIISGSSVLASVINKNWTNEHKHDIDIYSHSINATTFKKYLETLHVTFSNHYLYEYVDYGSIVTFTLHIRRKKKIKLQFIFTCFSITSLTLNKIIENFDLDICQVLYNVKEKKVLCTGAFIQSLKTEYVIPYCLMSNDKIDQSIQIIRINKYIKKGFTKMLLPKKLSINTFENLLNNVIYKNVWYSCSIIPCDYFEVQKHLLMYLNKMNM